MDIVLNQIVQEIINHSQPRVYDWLIFTVYFLGFFVTIAVACFTYKIYNKQLELMKEQKEISEQQANIMEQQNKIALFEKRYEVFDTIVRVYNSLDNLLFEYDTKSLSHTIKVISENSLYINLKNDVTYLNATKIKYLFNEDLYSDCKEIIEIATNYIEVININSRLRVGKQTSGTEMLFSDVQKEEIPARMKNINFRLIERKFEKYLTP